MRIHASRGGILAGAVTGLALITVGTIATLSFRSTGTENVGAAVATPGERRVEPREVASLLVEAGLEPQALAAAGVSGLQCDGIFEAALTYCIQADRMTQFRLAHKAVNQRKARAVNVSAVVDGPEQTSAQARAALDELKNSAFQFVTAGLTQPQIAMLSKIKANKHWGLPVQYSAADRTSEQWLALRGALAAQRAAIKRGRSLASGPAQVLSAANSNEAVAAAKAALTSNLDGVRLSWDTHSRPAPTP